MANAAVDLLTWAEWQAWAGVQPENPNVNQAQVALMITAASRSFQREAGGRVFISAADAQEFAGHNGANQQLRYPPVASSPTPVIEYWNDTAWTAAAAASYPRQISLTTGEVRMTSGVFSRGLLWRITYTGGYSCATVPEDIKGAVFDMVQRARKRVEGKQGIKSDARGNQSTSYDLAELMTDQIRKIAIGYRVIYNR